MEKKHIDLMNRLFDLNDKDCIVYDGFLNGYKTARQISDFLRKNNEKLPQNKIYYHIKRLQEASLIRPEKTGYAKTYVLTDPRKAIMGEIGILGDESEGLVGELEDIFSKIKSGIEEPDNEALVVQDKGIEIELKELVACAKHEVCGVGHYFEWIKKASWMRPLQKLHRDNVKVRIIALDNESTKNNITPLVSIGKFMEAKLVNQELIKKGYIVIDKEIVMCSLSIGTEKTTKAIVIKDPAVAGIFYNNFEALWTQGKTLEGK